MMRSSRIGLLALSVSLVLGMVALAGSGGAGAVTALMMGGTSQPYPDRVSGYMETTARRYLDAVSACKIDDCDRVSTYVPNEASPLYTSGMVYGDSVAVGTALLDIEVRKALRDNSEPVVVFGNSQSASVAIEVKRLLAEDPSIAADRLHFVVIGNPNRPNGGFMQRFFPGVVPIFEYRPNGTPVSDSGIKTTDIAFQYDIAADFPRYPGNLLAVLNVFAGMAVHGAYDDKVNPNGYTEEELRAQIDNLKNHRIVGDTTYITIPTKVLPLAQALRGVGYTTGTSAVLTPLADLIEPALRVLVELGYDRGVSPDVQNSFGAFPKVNAIKVAGDIGVALGQGFKNMVTNVIARQRGNSALQEPAESSSAAGRGALGADTPSAPQPFSGPTDDGLNDGNERITSGNRQSSRIANVDPIRAGEDDNLDDNAGTDGEPLTDHTVEPGGEPGLDNGEHGSDPAPGADDTDAADSDDQQAEPSESAESEPAAA